MAIAQTLLPEFEHEISTTRRVLERVPTDKFDWRPHPKSGTFGWLAGHVANIPMWAQMTLTTDELDIAPEGGSSPPPTPATSEQLMEFFEANVEKAREALTAATDEAMHAVWRLKAGDKELMAMPRVAVMRTMIMNHLVHHRGQLSVYLRLNDIPVPSMYGPSADEGGGF